MSPAPVSWFLLPRVASSLLGLFQDNKKLDVKLFYKADNTGMSLIVVGMCSFVQAPEAGHSAHPYSPETSVAPLGTGDKV